MFIGFGIHAKKNKFTANAQPFIKIAGRLSLIKEADIMHARTKPVSVQVKTMAPASWNVMLFDDRHSLPGAGKTDCG